MAVFLGDTAFYLATIVFGFGITLLYFSKKEKSKLLKFGGSVLTLVSVLGALCTGYYWLKYYSEDQYKSPYPSHSMQGMMKNMMGKEGMMSGGMGMMQGMMMKNMQHCMGKMSGKMMNPEMMSNMQGCMKQGMMNQNNKEMSEEEHKSHH